MARTYYWSDAIAACSPRGSRMGEANMQSIIVNQALNEVWRAYDWRESISHLPPFFLLPQEQDNYEPFAVVPADFFGLRQVYLTHLSSSTPGSRSPLLVVQDLPLTHEEGLPKEISFERSLIDRGSDRGGFRVNPRPPASLACCDWQIEGTFKRKPTLVTATTIQSTLLPIDDQYFDVICSAIDWAYAARYATPQQELELKQRLDGKIAAMKAAEAFNQGDPVIHPSEPLVGGALGDNFNFW